MAMNAEEEEERKQRTRCNLKLQRRINFLIRSRSPYSTRVLHILRDITLGDCSTQESCLLKTLSTESPVCIILYCHIPSSSQRFLFVSL